MSGVKGADIYPSFHFTIILIFYMCECFATWIAVCHIKNRTSDPLELELQIVVCGDILFVL